MNNNHWTDIAREKARSAARERRGKGALPKDALCMGFVRGLAEKIECSKCGAVIRLRQISPLTPDGERHRCWE